MNYNRKGFSIIEALKFPFVAIHEHVGSILKNLLILLFISVINTSFFLLGIFGAMYLLASSFGVSLSDTQSITQFIAVMKTSDNTSPSVLAFWFASLLVFLIFLWVASVVHAGFIKMGLNLYEHRDLSVKELIAQKRFAYRIIAASILFTIGFFASSILLIIPGVIFFITYYLLFYALIDEDLGIIDSFKRSAQISRGARMKLLGLFSVDLIVAIICVNVIAFIPVVRILATPVNILLMAFIAFSNIYAFRKLKEQTDAYSIQ